MHSPHAQRSCEGLWPSWTRSHVARRAKLSPRLARAHHPRRAKLHELNPAPNERTTKVALKRPRGALFFDSRRWAHIECCNGPRGPFSKPHGHPERSSHPQIHPQSQTRGLPRGVATLSTPGIHEAKASWRRPKAHARVMGLRPSPSWGLGGEERTPARVSRTHDPL